MATVRIDRFEARVEGMAAGRRLITQVLAEVKAGAIARLATGPYTTGDLAASIDSDIHETGTTIRGSLGSELPYAASVHGGASIHEIYPKGAPHVYRFGDHRQPQLKFYWRKVGQTVYFPHIPGGPSRIGLSHPGQKGKEYLTEPLRRAARRHNMRYVKTGRD